MKLDTMGFTKKSAETFFTKLKDAGVKRLIDVRLNNVSQLAGFTKKEDLAYFAKAICNVDYLHFTDLAPTKDLLNTYRRKKVNWAGYEKQFTKLLRSREIEKKFSPDVFDQSCLLCSEETPQHCHRRLIAEYLKKHWRDLEIAHIP